MLFTMCTGIVHHMILQRRVHMLIQMSITFKKLEKYLMQSISKKCLYGPQSLSELQHVCLPISWKCGVIFDHGNMQLFLVFICFCFFKVCLEFFLLWYNAAVTFIYWQPFKALKSRNHYCKGESLASQVTLHSASTVHDKVIKATIVDVLVMFLNTRWQCILMA